MSSEMLLTRVSTLVATIFEVPLAQVTPETSYTSVEKWDSMGHLMLILEVEQEFGVQLDPDQTEQMTSVENIVMVLENARIPVLRS
jgi:acyl carrier protein